MKVKIFYEVDQCDTCGKMDVSPYYCLSCGKMFCNNCYKKHCIQYKGMVHFTSSADGIYCNECNKRLLEEGNDTLFEAYRRIFTISRDYCNFKKKIDLQTEEAERQLEELLEERKEKIK